MEVINLDHVQQVLDGLPQDFWDEIALLQAPAVPSLPTAMEAPACSTGIPDQFPWEVCPDTPVRPDDAPPLADSTALEVLPSSEPPVASMASVPTSSQGRTSYKSPRSAVSKTKASKRKSVSPRATTTSSSRARKSAGSSHSRIKRPTVPKRQACHQLHHDIFNVSTGTGDRLATPWEPAPELTITTAITPVRPDDPNNRDYHILQRVPPPRVPASISNAKETPTSSRPPKPDSLPARAGPYFLLVPSMDNLSPIAIRALCSRCDQKVMAAIQSFYVQDSEGQATSSSSGNP